MTWIDSLSSGIPGSGAVVMTTRPRSFVSSYSVPEVCLLTMSFQPFCEGKKYREYLPAGTKRYPDRNIRFRHENRGKRRRFWPDAATRELIAELVTCLPCDGAIHYAQFLDTSMRSIQDRLGGCESTGFILGTATIFTVCEYCCPNEEK